ncbi:MAG: hypothetical protein HYW01_09360 [Deltaproteobacteria bacterium]|nr:hypothetical protein [Deltaproteobacteria bacterium]
MKSIGGEQGSTVLTANKIRPYFLTWVTSYRLSLKIVISYPELMRNKIALVSLIFFLSGCYAAGLRNGEGSLKKTASLYYNLLMWKYYDRASAFVDEEKRGKFEKFVSESQDELNITSYQIKELIFKGNEEKESSVKVLITYYKYPSVSEKTVSLQDTWVQKKGNWYISSDFEAGLFK